jgi:hypothetical protein
MSLKQCMGGWCQARANCAHYFAPDLPGIEPSNRLCDPGADEPVLIRRAELEAQMTKPTPQPATTV